MQKSKHKTTLKKIRKMSDNLLRLRVRLIVMKRKVLPEPDSIGEFLVKREFDMLDKIVSEAEMEYGVLKFVWFNVER